MAMLGTTCGHSQFSYLEDVDSIFVARVSPNTLLKKPAGLSQVAQLKLHDTPCLQQKVKFETDKVMVGDWLA
jgi:hypothetical protein